MQIPLSKQQALPVPTPETPPVPTSEIEFNVGEFNINKGKIDTKKMMYAWDAVRECDREDCNAFLMCPHPKNSHCTTQVLYLESVLSVILSNFNVEEDELYRIGMHLIPLYKMLCRLKIEELGVSSYIYTTDKGNFNAHPILREIRETIKMVESMWKDLGLDSEKKLVPNPSLSISPKANYYDDILQEETKVGWKKGRERK